MRARPDFFSGVVLLSTSTPMDFQWDERFRYTAIWAFTNLDDAAVSTPEMRNFINRVNDSGGIAALTVREIGGHDTWTSAMKDDKAVAWLAHRCRTRSSPPPGVVMYVRNDWRKRIHLIFQPP